MIWKISLQFCALNSISPVANSIYACISIKKEQKICLRRHKIFHGWTQGYNIRMKIETAYLKPLKKNGFALVESVLSEDEVQQVLYSIENYRQSKSGKLPGLRNLFIHCPEVKEFAHSKKLLNLANEILGANARPIKGTLFDKTADSNWYVTWHQDRTIVVKEKFETPGFGPWRVKDNTNNVQPPHEILEQVVAFRIHLDDCPEENGAIKFVPGSHSHGFIDPEHISTFRQGKEVVICPAKKGDIILMRPLILHASSQVEEPKNRRVLHIEYSNAVLPGKLEWLA